MLQFFSGDPIMTIGKIAVLALILTYLIFLLIVLSQIRSLNRIVFIRASSGTLITQIILIIYILLVASLFLFALAIL